jgi:hypothetical protein
MKQQTPKDTCFNLVDYIKDFELKLRFGGFAAQIEIRNACKLKCSSSPKKSPRKKKASSYGLRSKVDFGLVTFVTLIIAGPFIIHLTTDYLDWFVATEVARYLGISLKPEQINLLLDKTFDVLLVLIARRSVN